MGSKRKETDDTSDDVDNGETIFIAAGTYDGVLAGYEWSQHSNKLQLICAVPTHNGSVRDLTVTSPSNRLVSTGYDETLKLHDFSKHVTNTGEIRTPADFGTPMSIQFAPPTNHPTHCLVGFGSSLNPDHPGGKLVIYKKRDWSIQHVLAGHEGGISCMAVHPSGKLALTGGLSDGKLKVWDLEKGRLAYSTSVVKSVQSVVDGRKHYESISSIVWRANHTDCYAFCHGNHTTVRDVDSGKDLLDVELPSRVNQICLLDVSEGLYVAAACNDGSLPVLAIEDDPSEERRAIMAIEPVDGAIAKEERFKCIHAVRDALVAVAASSGVVSLYDLSGAIGMISAPHGDDDSQADSDDEDKEKPRNESDDEEEEELAVEILDSVPLGTGARITCLAAWSSTEEDPSPVPQEPVKAEPSNKKQRRTKEVVMDSAAIEKARALVTKAKKIQKKKKRSKQKLTKSR